MPASSDLDGLRIVLDPIRQLGVAAPLMLVMFAVARDYASRQCRDRAQCVRVCDRGNNSMVLSRDAAVIAAIWGVWHLLAGGLLVMAYTFYDRRTIDKVEGNSADN